MLLEDGTLLGRGNNHAGQIGVGGLGSIDSVPGSSLGPIVSTFEQVEIDEKVVDVRSHSRTTTAITESGDI